MGDVLLKKSSSDFGGTGIERKLWLPSRFKNVEEVTFELAKEYNINMLFAIGDEGCIAGKGHDKDRSISIDYERSIDDDGLYQEVHFNRLGEELDVEGIGVLNFEETKDVSVTYASLIKETCFKRFLEIPDLKGEYDNRYSHFLKEMNEYVSFDLPSQKTDPDFPHIFPVVSFLFYGIKKRELKTIVKYVLG